jgi:hypothetical protein
MMTALRMCAAGWPTTACVGSVITHELLRVAGRHSIQCLTLLYLEVDLLCLDLERLENTRLDVGEARVSLEGTCRRCNVCQT